MKGPRALLTAAFLVVLGLAIGNAIQAQVVNNGMLLQPFDPDFDQNFGYSVAISGSTAVVGAPEAGLRVGAAYVFNKVGTNWVQRQKLIPPTATNDNLVGISVAIDGNLLAIGAPGFATNPADGPPGFVYLYQRNTNGVWLSQGRLTAPDWQRGDRFGVSVALSGQSLVVGSSFHSDSGATNNGSIYTYDFTPFGWALVAKLLPRDLTNSDMFGARVAINQDTIVAGAFGQALSTGAAYVFTRQVSNFFAPAWSLQQKLVPPNLNTGAQFGFSVAVNDDNALIGAPRTSGGGRVFAFIRNNTNWFERVPIVSTNLTNNDSFGWSISMQGNRAIIGAPGKNSNDLARVGAAYIFSQDQTNNWIEQQQLLPLQFGNNFHFGTSVAIGTQAVIAGADAARLGNGLGAAYVFNGEEEFVPIVSATASPPVLFPSTNEFVPVTINVNTTATNITSKIIAVTSNQPVVGLGDNADAPDWVVTGDLTLLLRAELPDNRNFNRIYYITVQSTDSFGNFATTTVQVTASFLPPG